MVYLIQVQIFSSVFYFTILYRNSWQNYEMVIFVTLKHWMVLNIPKWCKFIQFTHSYVGNKAKCLYFWLYKTHGVFSSLNHKNINSVLKALRFPNKWKIESNKDTFSLLNWDVYWRTQQYFQIKRKMENWVLKQFDKAKINSLNLLCCSLPW